MTPLELQGLVGRMLPGDFNCELQVTDSSIQVKIANWCESTDACELFYEQLDQPEDMLQRTLKPFLTQAVKDLRGNQTKNRRGA